MVRISSVSPELDSSSTTSLSLTMPRSPWLASPGCRKKAGVPVEARVAAILVAMWPDLPMPVQTTRPRQASSSRQACGERRPDAGLQRLQRLRLDLEHALAAGDQRVGVGGLGWRAGHSCAGAGGMM